MMHHQEKAVEEYPLALLYQKYAKVILIYLDRRISIKEDAEDLLPTTLAHPPQKPA